MAYLTGWMAFDNAEQGTAQRYFTVAVQLAAEAGDAPMAGHVLRAMAHQALDLGHYRQALNLATASMDGDRYQASSRRERALLGVVYARALGATGQRTAAAAALTKAEDDLAAARSGDVGSHPSGRHFGSSQSPMWSAGAPSRQMTIGGRRCRSSASTPADSVLMPQRGWLTSRTWR